MLYFSSVPSVQSLTVFTQALPPHATEALYWNMTPSFKKSRIRKLTRSHHTFPSTSLVIPAFRKHKEAFWSQHARVCVRVRAAWFTALTSTLTNPWVSCNCFSGQRTTRGNAHTRRGDFCAVDAGQRGTTLKISATKTSHNVTMCVRTFREQIYKMQWPVILA